MEREKHKPLCCKMLSELCCWSKKVWDLGKQDRYAASWTSQDWESSQHLYVSQAQQLLSSTSPEESDWRMCSFCLVFQVNLLALLSHPWTVVLPSHKVFHGCSQFRCCKLETSGDESLELRMRQVSQKQENRLCENLKLRVDSQTRKDPDFLVSEVMSSLMVCWEVWGLKCVAVLKKKKMFLLLQEVNYIFLKMQIGKKCKMEKNSAWSSADIWFLSW